MSRLAIPGLFIYVVLAGVGREARANEEFKNVQVLKSLTMPQLDKVMDVASAALGVRCGHCHVKTGDKWEWEKDDKPAKKTARRMLDMTLYVNKSTFGGNLEVTCWTCHQGKLEPSRIPSLPRPAMAPPAAPAAGAKASAPAPLPSVADVLDRYVKALGGKAALGKLKTRVAKGTFEIGDGKPAAIEIWQKAPGKGLTVKAMPPGERRDGTDGKIGWVKFGSFPIHDVTDDDLLAMKQESDIARALRLKQTLPGLKVAGRDRVGDRDAIVLSSEGHGRAVRLSFDAQTGLLLRRLTLTETPVGAIPEQVELDDYRAVGAVKEPFVVKVATAGSTEVHRFATIEHDVPVDDAMFARPAAADAPHRP